MDGGSSRGTWTLGHWLCRRGAFKCPGRHGMSGWRWRPCPVFGWYPWSLRVDLTTVTWYLCCGCWTTNGYPACSPVFLIRRRRTSLPWWFWSWRWGPRSAWWWWWVWRWRGCWCWGGGEEGGIESKLLRLCVTPRVQGLTEKLVTDTSPQVVKT